jgi:hypothetical protein
MTLRRRIALFLDPDLLVEPPDPTPEPLRLDWSHRPLSDISSELSSIAKTLDRIERFKRRPRIVECRHPELHPELEQVA